jgi:hypothetical protein
MRYTPIPILLVTNKETPLELKRIELQTKFLYKIYNKNIFKQHTNTWYMLAKLLCKPKLSLTEYSESDYQYYTKKPTFRIL